ncbi:MAG: hypothetical protein ACOC29_01920 [Candidatus Sumerlaeota bacterium]
MAKKKRKNIPSRKTAPEPQPSIPEKEESNAESGKELAEWTSGVFNAALVILTVPRVVLIVAILSAVLLLLGLTLHRSAFQQARGTYLYEQGQWIDALPKLLALDFERKLAAQAFSKIVHAYVEMGEAQKALDASEEYSIKIQAELDKIKTLAELDKNDLLESRQRALEQAQQRISGFRSWALIATNRDLEGYQIARDILKKQPDNPVANIALGRYYLKTNEPAEARDHYITAAYSKAYRPYFQEYETATGR